MSKPGNRYYGILNRGLNKSTFWKKYFVEQKSINTKWSEIIERNKYPDEIKI